jgi:hypothetical protein
MSEIERWCYNCAERGHLGDDCDRPRPFHVQGGRIGVVISAFGEGNVPEWAKLSVVRRRERSKSPVKSKRKKDDPDDWFANRGREEVKELPKPIRRIGGIKMKPISSHGSNSSSGMRQNGPLSLTDRIEGGSISKAPPSSTEYRSRQRHTDRGDREWEDEVQNWRKDRDIERSNRR